MFLVSSICSHLFPCKHIKGSKILIRYRYFNSFFGSAYVKIIGGLIQIFLLDVFIDLKIRLGTAGDNTSVNLYEIL